jgi:hypothetical protein
VRTEMDRCGQPAAAVKDPAFASELWRRHVDVLLNVHSRHLIDPEVLAAPRIGSFNLHPVHVAATDEWVLVSRLRVDGRSVAPMAVLEPGTSLLAGVR